MKIHGLQKITLLDYPGLVACTVFAGGCDFRCPFCHNAPLVTEPWPDAIGEEEIFSFLRKRRGLLDGVCVTGGEPLMQPDIADFLTRIRQLGYKIKLDTNGSYPERLRTVVEAGLTDLIAMDIKNSPAKYAATAGVPGLDLGPVRESAAFLMEGRVPFEFRTTAVWPLHEKEDFIAIGEWLRGNENYYLQQFIDSGDLIRPDGLGAYSIEAMRIFADTVRPYIPNTFLRGVEE
jgi:anaerobic ribonucleoside-triphosphate reductase activating protein